MALNTKKNGKKKNSTVISALDIVKGWTGYNLNAQNIWAYQPLQCLPLEEKDEDWIKWNAHWFESYALRELPDKARKLNKLYNLAVGRIDRSDYVINPSNDMSGHMGAMKIGENDQTLLDQFFPIIPNIINVFLGELSKRDRAVYVEATDPESLSEQLEYKQGLVSQIVMQAAMAEKQAELMKMGILPGGQTQDQFQQQMQTASQLAQAEQQFKKYRTIAEQWAQKFVDMFGVRHRFSELEFFAFADALIADETIFALNLREDGFTPERLQPKETIVIKSPNKRYYSESLAVINIQFMSIPDIINTFRNDLAVDQVQLLETQYNHVMSNGVMFDYQNGRSETYYDASQSRDWNNMYSPAMKEEQSAAAVRDYLIGALKGDNNQEDHFNSNKLQRVSRIWWCSQRKVGLLTKKDGTMAEPIIEQVDENFLVTEKPVYDKSLLKEETADTLIKGEHIDWKWVNEWHYVVKIGQNIPMYKPADTQPYNDIIYLYGDPIRFQFKSTQSLYEARPPIEGCRFSNPNVQGVSLVEQLRPWQIDYNILNNKGLKLLINDYGKKLVVGRTTIKRNSLLQEDGLEPVLEFEQNLRDSPVIDLDDSREASAETNGRNIEPKVIELSMVEYIAQYFQIAQFVKNEAYGSIGITAQRLGQVGKSESATGIQQADEASVNTTEIYFETFLVHLMPRVWNMIVEAGQYYTTLNPDFAASYLTSAEERAFFDVNQLDLLMRDLFVNVRNTADVRKVMSDLKQLCIQDNTMGATFLDKVKAYLSKSPTELIEKLEKAEAQRQQIQQSEQQQQMQLQQQQQQFLAQQKQQDMQFQDAELQKKLESAERIAESKNNTSIATMPDSNNQEANNLQAAKLQQQQDTASAQNELNFRKQAMAEKQHQDSQSLEQQKLQVEREKMQNQLQIAGENKSNADIKFIQMQRNKAKTKSK